MKEKQYPISEASELLQTESHVLRYWENELNLSIPRNELGHRYYTEQHIHMLKQIKELREGGYQLKAIKMILPKLSNLDEEDISHLTMLAEEMNKRAYMEEKKSEQSNSTSNDKSGSESSNDEKNSLEIPKSNKVIPLSRSKGNVLDSRDERFEQFQELLNDAVSQALLSNSQLLGNYLNAYIGAPVTERLIDELNLHFQTNEQIQEARFKQIDEQIRMHQRKGLIEAAAAKAPKKKRGLFKKTSQKDDFD